MACRRIVIVIGLVMLLSACAEGLPDMSTQKDQSSQTPPVTIEPPPLNPPPLAPKISEFQWSYVGPIAGKTCVLWSEPGDPNAWDDNYLCSDRNFNLTWKFALPLDPAATCTRILETEDPHHWDDNFLCAPSNLGFQWSSAGPIAGMSCLQIIEPGEPLAHAWDDNYLCLPP